jgi:hypothetical protein
MAAFGSDQRSAQARPLLTPVAVTSRTMPARMAAEVREDPDGERVPRKRWGGPLAKEFRSSLAPLALSFGLRRETSNVGPPMRTVNRRKPARFDDPEVARVTSVATVDQQQTVAELGG